MKPTRPSNRGKRMWKCQDCGVRRFVHWVELNRRGRLKCMGCGSIRMEPDSDAAKGSVVDAATQRKAHDDDRGDLVRATQ
jgi:hypothetical protein